MTDTPFYDPMLSYEDNYQKGPFGLFATKNPSPRTVQPTRELFGQAIATPFGIPAGPLLNSKYVTAALDWGYDIAVYKTVRSRAQDSLPFPNVLGVDVDGNLQPNDTVRARKTGDFDTIPNSFGVPSFDPKIWQPDMAQAAESAGTGQIVIGSFQGTGRDDEQIADYAVTATLVAETGVPVIEANLSCPNEGTSHLLCFAIDKVASIVDGIKKAVPNKSLILKLAYFADPAELAKLVQTVGPKVQGFAAINTLPARVINDLNQPALGGENRTISGICGRAIRWAGLDMVQRLIELRASLGLDFAVIASGGVVTAKDYEAYRELGADAVMSATGAMLDPQLACEIAKLGK
jgi:dihydroorotate dehydrogenase